MTLMSSSTYDERGASRAEAESELARNRAVRESALSEARRNLILDAARAAFLELGLDGASLREIAKRAGYTPGAIYTYFSNLEELYGALLEESLQRLKAEVDAAASDMPAVDAAASDMPVAAGAPSTPGAAVTPTADTRSAEARSADADLPDAPSADALRSAQARLIATARAFYSFYRDHPNDLDLGFYLFNGARPRGLTPELNRRLNNQLMQALEPIRRNLLDMGHSADEATLITTGIFAHAVGTLMLANTGRIRLFRQDPDTLFTRYLTALLK